jgi:hypothetical protein
MDSKGSQRFAEEFSPTVGRRTRRLVFVYGRKLKTNRVQHHNKNNCCDRRFIVLFKTFRRKVAYLVISNCKQIQKYSTDILQNKMYY